MAAPSVDDVVQVIVPRLQDAVASEIRNLAQELAARADEVRAEAEAEHEASLAREREQALAARAEAVSAAVAAARAQAAQGVASRLLDAIRRLDEQTTLSGVLDALTDLAAAEAGRAGLFVAADQGVGVWRLVGLDAPAGERKQVLAATETGVVGRAMHERRSVAVTREAAEDGGNGPDRPDGPPTGSAGSREAEDGGNGADRPPAFVTLPEGGTGVAVPIRIGGEPLVAVYADDGSEGGGSDSARWMPVVEILASHAGSRLEALAAERAAAFAREAVAPAS